MYKFRKEWNDVQPIGQEGQEISIVSIRYSDEFRETFNYFRAIEANGEKSERALNLTTHALNLNPNNYVVWDYRRQIIKAIKCNLQKELYYMDYLIRENPKNHLLWYHRRCIANMCLLSLNIKSELDLTETVLEDDQRSYNAWEHRQWIVNTFKFSKSGLARDELDFTTKFIEKDVRNNSAWNQRFFIIKRLGQADFNLIKQEFSFILENLKLVLDNESTWNYLRGILTTFGLKKLGQCQEIVEFVENSFYELKITNRHLVGFLIDLKIEMILDMCEANEIYHSRKLKELCDLMANQYDKIRKKYWKFVYKQFYFDKMKLRADAVDASVPGGSTNESWKQITGKNIENDESEKCRDEYFRNNQMKLQIQKLAKAKEFKDLKVNRKKKKTPERTIKIGTNLLFDLMAKYER